MDIIVGIYKVISRLIYISLKSFLMYVVFTRMAFRQEFNESIMLAFTYILVTTIYLLKELYNMKIKNIFASKKYMGIFSDVNFYKVVSIIISIIFSIVSSYGTSIKNYFLSFLYFILINYCCAYSGKRIKPKYELILSLFVSFMVMAIYYENKIELLGNNYAEMSIILFIFCLIYLLINNLCYQYENNASINKKKNIVILNTIFTAILVILSFFKDKAVSVLMKGISKVQPFFENLLTYLVNLLNPNIEKFAYEVSKIASKKTLFQQYGDKSRIEIDKNSYNDGKIMKAILDFIRSMNIVHIYRVFFALFIIFLITVIFLMVRHHIKKKAANKSFETKEFIFTRNDIFNILKKSVKNVFGAKEELSEVRLKYKSTVEGLIGQGYKFHPQYTPNEYNVCTCEHIEEKESLSILTEEYNENRYGQ